MTALARQPEVPLQRSTRTGLSHGQRDWWRLGRGEATKVFGRDVFVLMTSKAKVHSASLRNLWRVSRKGGTRSGAHVTRLHRVFSATPALGTAPHVQLHLPLCLIPLCCCLPYQACTLEGRARLLCSQGWQSDTSSTPSVDAVHYVVSDGAAAPAVEVALQTQHWRVLTKTCILERVQVRRSALPWLCPAQLCGS